MKLWLVIYIAHQVIFSQAQPPNMGKCETNITLAHRILGQYDQPVSENIAPQYRKKTVPEESIFCMWAEKDPILNDHRS